MTHNLQHEFRLMIGAGKTNVKTPPFLAAGGAVPAVAANAAGNLDEEGAGEADMVTSDCVWVREMLRRGKQKLRRRRTAVDVRIVLQSQTSQRNSAYACAAIHHIS